MIIPNAEKWKAEQRDWLVQQLKSLATSWKIQAESTSCQFCTDPEQDRVAKARTGACAIELRRLLDELG